MKLHTLSMQLIICDQLSAATMAAVPFEFYFYFLLNVYATCLTVEATVEACQKGTAKRIPKSGRHAPQIS